MRANDRHQPLLFLSILDSVNHSEHWNEVLTMCKVGERQWVGYEALLIALVTEHSHDNWAAGVLC